MIRGGVLGRDHIGAVIGIDGLYAGCRRARMQVRVAFAPEAGEEEGVTRAEVMGADAGALKTVDGFIDHLAHAAGFFRAGDT